MEPKAYKHWIEGIFDRSAQLYGQELNNFFDYFGKNLVTLAALPAAAHVLDVATGRGAVLKEVARAVGPQGKVVGIDISHNMISQTTQELQGYNNIELICMDAENLAFDDNSFDYIFCGFCIFFFPHLPQALHEFFRVLKPGGKIFISTWGKDDELAAIFSEIYKQFGITVTPRFHNFEDKGFDDFLSAQGFKDIKKVVDELICVYPTINDWITVLWSSATRARLEQLNPQQLEILKAALHERLSPYLKDDGLHKVRRAHYTYATKRG